MVTYDYKGISFLFLSLANRSAHKSTCQKCKEVKRKGDMSTIHVDPKPENLNTKPQTLHPKPLRPKPLNPKPLNP